MTENSLDFHFSDFTHEEYISLLDIAKERWNFRCYDNFHQDEKFILWRHDVDFSMHAARNLAKLEAEAGVSATYFILPHSEFYNLFEREITDLVKTILSLGHQIGLHFDSHYYDIRNELQLEKYLLIEKKWLEGIFEKEIKVFSFHNTNEFTMSCKQWQYAGLINTYASFFQEEIEYCSDSNGIWRYKRLKNVLNDESTKSLQILTHPEWWQAEILSPLDKVKRCLDGRSKKHLNFYLEALSKADRPNIDW